MGWPMRPVPTNPTRMASPPSLPVLPISRPGARFSLKHERRRAAPLQNLEPDEKSGDRRVRATVDRSRAVEAIRDDPCTGIDAEVLDRLVHHGEPALGLTQAQVGQRLAVQLKLPHLLFHDDPPLRRKTGRRRAVRSIPGTLQGKGACGLERGDATSNSGAEGIQTNDAGPLDVLDVARDECQTVYLGGGGEQAVHHRQWIWNIEAAPLLGGRLFYREKPVHVTVLQLAEPIFQRLGGRRVTPPDVFDPFADL